MNKYLSLLITLLLCLALLLPVFTCAESASGEAERMILDAFEQLRTQVQADPARMKEVEPAYPYGTEYPVCTLDLNGKKMQYMMTVIGDPDENGKYPLYITLHGGGGGEGADETNDEQWRQMFWYYRSSVKNGIYVTCRGIEDTWNTLFVEDSFPLYDRLIEDMILLKNADPNRVYLLGFSAGGDGVYAITPRMADRFAAVNMSSGHPNGVCLINAANVPFEIQAGVRDFYSDSLTRPRTLIRSGLPRM